MIKSLVFGVFLMMLFVPAGFCSQGEPHPQKGVLDLRSYQNFDGKVMTLQGDWMFYWHRLLSPDSINWSGDAAGVTFVHVPSYWTSYRGSDGNSLPGTGYATYGLRILLPRGYRDSLGFSLPVFDSSFGFFLNGKRQGVNGKVSRTKTAGVPGYSPFVTYFRPVSDTLNLVLQVSNYDHRRGGFWKEIMFGKAGAIQKRQNVNALIVDLSLGVLLAYFMFFLFFYLIFPRSKMLLFFALTLAGIFIRLSFTNIFPLQLIFHTSWTWLIRFEYLGTFMAFCFGLWYLYSLFPSRIARYFTIINSFISGVLTVIILVVKVRIFAWSMLYLEPVAMIALLWYLVYTLNRIIQRKKGHLLYFIALLLFLFALVNDIFLANSWSALVGNYVLHFSVLFLIVVQAVMIIRNWVGIFTEKEGLFSRIKLINVNLEDLVRERTNEINERTMEIRKQNKKIVLQNDELQREIEFKNRFFSIIAHDLRGPLASINLYLQMAAKDIPLAKRIDILESTATTAGSAMNLVENLLYWGRSQDKQLSIHPRECFVEDIVGEIYTLLGEIARQKGVELIHIAGSRTKITADREIILIILRNLISNAIKFSTRGNQIAVLVKAEKDSIIITVEDHGIGMSTEQIENVFSDEALFSTYGTGNEKGTGLGLRLCLDLVRLHQGNLEISSVTGKGTSVKISLPRDLPEQEK